MGLYLLLLHLAAFAAPALVLAVLLPLAARWLLPAGARGRWKAQAAACLGVGLLVLGGGLWWFGHDGKMATYGALVLAVATTQWLMAGGWRR